jgi:hypothetical protein
MMRFSGPTLTRTDAIMRRAAAAATAKRNRNNEVPMIKSGEILIDAPERVLG